MVCIPYTPRQWEGIERAYRLTFPEDKRKKLPVREVAKFWAEWTGTRVVLGEF